MSLDQAAASYSDDSDSGLGIRLKENLNLNKLHEGVEFNIDESSLPKNQPEESSTYFEHADLYKNSELFGLGDSESDEEDDTLSDFERLRKKMLPVTADGGVMKRVLREGMGPTISEYIESMQRMEDTKPEDQRRTIEEDDIQVAYHYSGIQEFDEEPFDVTYLRDDRPQKADLNNEFFPGFRLAVASMKHKEVADFLISPDYAFGAMGCPPRIKPNASLRYKIDLVNFWATTEIDSYAKMSREDKKLVSVTKLVKLCSKQREEANKLYGGADFKGAIHHYGKAIRLLENASLLNDADEALQRKALLKLYLNRSICAIKLEKWDHAITFSNKALDIDPKNAKALYRKAKGKMEYGDYSAAKKIAQLAHSEYPNEQSIGKLLYDIDRREARDRKTEKMMYRKMFDFTAPEKCEATEFSAEHLHQFRSQIKQFKDSSLKELKLNAVTYTNKELDGLATAAAQMNLTVHKHKEKDEWISLKLKKTD